MRVILFFRSRVDEHSTFPGRPATRSASPPTAPAPPLNDDPNINISLLQITMPPIHRMQIAGAAAPSAHTGTLPWSLDVVSPLLILRRRREEWQEADMQWGVAAVGRWEMRPRVWAEEPCVRGRPKDGRSVGLEMLLAACSTKAMRYNLKANASIHPQERKGIISRNTRTARI
jgi:hypothetical protein